MFFFRPNASLTTEGVRPFKASSEQRGPVSSLFFSLSPRQKLQSGRSNRRATDSLGMRPVAPGAHKVPFFVTVNGRQAQAGKLVLEYMGEEWMSPEENSQLLELNDGAEQVMSELSQTDRALAALATQSHNGYIAPDLSMTAQQTFARIDNLMQRWTLRAEQIEQANSGNQWVAFNPVTGNRYQGMPSMRRPGARILPQQQAQHSHAQPAARPGTLAASRAGDRRYSLPADVAGRPLSPAAQIRNRRLRLNEKYNTTNNGKVVSLRDQMNRLAAMSSSPALALGRNSMRRIALARLASLHDSIDNMAHELHEHRHQVELNISQRLDRRRGPRSPLPAPVLKPKTKGETTT